MEEKLCPHCGAYAAEEAKFCIKCGAPLTDTPSVDSSKEQMPAIPPQYAPSQTDFSAHPATPYETVTVQPSIYASQLPTESVPEATYTSPRVGSAVPFPDGFPHPCAGVPQSAQSPYTLYNGGVLRFCRHCGRPLPTGATMCLQCGVAVGGGNAFCPQCGQAVMPGAAMCVRCYTPLVFPNQKSRIVAGLLGIFLGFLGIHNFYLDHTGRGLTQLLVTLLLSWLILPPVAMFVWGLVEGIRILAGNVAMDAKGIPLKD